MSNTTETAHLSGLKRIGLAATCGTVACALGVGTAAAYLTGTSTTTSPFTLDTNLKITLTEPAFNANNAKALKPYQSVAKDPTVTNTGTVPAYIAVDIKVPVFNGKAFKDGAVTSLTNEDLFGYSVNAGWTLVGTPKLEEGYRTYRYVYNNVLAANASTSSVFDSVRLANLTEDVGIQQTNVDVTAYAIQAEGFTSAQDAAGAYDTQAHATAKVTA